MHYPLPYYYDIALIISFSVRGAKLHIIIQTTKRNYIINIILITLSGKPKEGGRTHRVLPLERSLSVRRNRSTYIRSHFSSLLIITFSPSFNTRAL